VLNDASEYRDRLAHVLWIGGPPDCGKTSIADIIAEKHGLQVYHFDRCEGDHMRRAGPERQPNVVKLRTLVETLDERELAHELWLAHAPEAMAEFTVGSWSERVDLAVEDLIAMPGAPLIVAEGPGFFPRRILPLLADRGRAVWLVPSEEFKRASAIRRDKPGSRHLTSDPERAQENLIRRDVLMGDSVRRGVNELGLAMYEVDGSRSLEEMAATVEAQFGRWLG
jgi:hypothetical protein